MNVNTDSIKEMYQVVPPEGYQLLMRGQEVRRGDLWYSGTKSTWMPLQREGKVMFGGPIFVARKI